MIELDITETILHLRRISIFEGLDVGELAAIATVTRHVSVDSNQDFIREGDTGNAMYLVLDGEVAVIKASDKSPSHEIELARIRTGDYFGEMALFEDAPRSATIRTLRASQFLSLEKNGFSEIVREYPAIALHICRCFCQRIRELHEKINTCEF